MRRFLIKNLSKWAITPFILELRVDSLRQMLTSHKLAACEAYLDYQGRQCPCYNTQLRPKRKAKYRS